VSNYIVIAGDRRRHVVSGLATWMRVYLRRAVITGYAIGVVSSALNAGISLTAGLAIISYAVNSELSRAYLLLTMPSAVVLDLIARYVMRRRDTHHGISAVAAIRLVVAHGRTVSSGLVRR
jgi:hypothetical protein